MHMVVCLLKNTFQGLEVVFLFDETFSPQHGVNILLEITGPGSSLYRVATQFVRKVLFLEAGVYSIKG